MKLHSERPEPEERGGQETHHIYTKVGGGGRWLLSCAVLSSLCHPVPLGESVTHTSCISPVVYGTEEEGIAVTVAAHGAHPQKGDSRRKWGSKRALRIGPGARTQSEWGQEATTGPWDSSEKVVPRCPQLVKRRFELSDLIIKGQVTPGGWRGLCRPVPGGKCSAQCLSSVDAS